MHHVIGKLKETVGEHVKVNELLHLDPAIRIQIKEGPLLISPNEVMFGRVSWKLENDELFIIERIIIVFIAPGVLSLK